MEPKLFQKDEMGIFVNEEKIPYICIQLSQNEMASLPKKFTSEWYETDGKTLFEVRDKKGNKTGDFVAFLLLRS